MKAGMTYTEEGRMWWRAVRLVGCVGGRAVAGDGVSRELVALLI